MPLMNRRSPAAHQFNAVLLPEVNQDPPTDYADDFSFVSDLMFGHLITGPTLRFHVSSSEVP